MSSTTVLGVMPNRRPVAIAEWRNAHGWSPSIWNRLVKESYGYEGYVLMGEGERHLNRLWQSIEELPQWQQAPLVLTFDTGIIPFQEFGWAADQMDEFERRCPAPEWHVNHVPKMAELLRSAPEVPSVGVWGTSVTDNPFDPIEYHEEPESCDRWVSRGELGYCEGHGSGLPFDPQHVYVLERHRLYLSEHLRHLRPAQGSALCRGGGLR